MKRAKLMSAVLACAFLMGGCNMIDSLLAPDDREREEEDEDEEEETEDNDSLEAPTEPEKTRPSEPEETVAPETSETSETTAAVIDGAYAEAYIETIDDYLDDLEYGNEDDIRYDLIYIDEDSIPELIIGVPG
ncbi:MAG: hypothetical protein J5883_04875, partial [Clostridiales bacterium]|nr:hypothetical protein [Clostridiales bacterium]